MSDLQTLRSRLTDRISNFDKNNRIWSEDLRNQYIKRAVVKVQQEGDYQWHFNSAEYSVSTVASTREYALPSGFVRVESGTVKYDTNVVLDKIPYESLFRMYGDLTSEGQPGLYYIRGDNIGLYLVPNEVKTLSFLYRKQLDEMTADGSDSGLPSNFDDAIVSYAEYLAWKKIKKQDYQADALDQYQMEIDSLNTQYLGRRDESDWQFQYQVVS